MDLAKFYLRISVSCRVFRCYPEKHLILRQYEKKADQSNLPTQVFIFGKKRLVVPMSRRKKIVIGIVVGVLLLALGGAGYFVYRAALATSKVTKNSTILSIVEPEVALKTDSSNRTNILLFGTSQDDEAHQNASGGGGLWLTDSIMMISINQDTKVVSMISIPRDLWVNIPGGCSVGYQAKINAVYECGADLVYDDGNADNEDGYADKDANGAAALSEVMTTVTGLTPQYYVHVNYTVLKDVIDALGGIDVDIVGDGADGVYDTNFDWNCTDGPYTCKHVYYPTNGTYTLDGEAALYLARARSDAGLYSYKNFGLSGGDYSRQVNQQKIIQAIQKKVTTNTTLSNPVKVLNLLDALGTNITSDFEVGELKTLLSLAKKVDTTAMQTISLATDGEAVVGSMTISGQSAQIATSGLLDYTSIQAYITGKITPVTETTDSSDSSTDTTTSNN